MWLAPGIIVMQFITIFFPICEGMMIRHYQHAGPPLIKSTKHKHTPTSRSGDSLIPSTFSVASLNNDLYVETMLDKVLATNPDPLLYFAATKDFTAENIVFLMQVRKWRDAWDLAPRSKVSEMIGADVVTAAARARLYTSAVQIFITCVHDETALFAINLDSEVRNNLIAFFGPAVPEIKEGRKQVHFDLECCQESAELPGVPVTEKSKGYAITTLALPSDLSTATTPETEEDIVFFPHPSSQPGEPRRLKVRSGFDRRVFDAAEAHIKRIVLQYTWPNFIKCGEEGLLEKFGLQSI